MSSFTGAAAAVSITTQGIYEATPTTYVDGQLTATHTDNHGFQIVVGGVAHDAVDSGDPIKIGGKARSSAPADVSTNGDRVDAYFDMKGRQAVLLDSASVAYGAGGVSALTLRVKLSDEDVAYFDQLEGYVDGLETLVGSTNTAIATLNTYADGLEGLVGTTNTTLTTIGGYLDGLEGFTDGIEGSLTNLETLIKTEDAGHSTGDKGVMALAVRNDADAALTNTDLDYSPISVDSAGRQKVVATVTPTYLSVVDQIDTSPGPVLDAASNTIQDNAGTFLTLVASLAANVKKIRVADTTGEFLGVYTGAGGAEVLAFIINPGQSNEIEHTLASGIRISLRSMGLTDIVLGQLCMQFLG